MVRVIREQRLVFGEAAELYDRARPSYPAALVDDVLHLGEGAPGWMVDAGCGTGKAARLFAEAGVPGVGVEPDPRMAEVARRHLEPHRWRVDVDAFESWAPGPGDPPADLLVSAAAWHWFDPGTRFRRAFAILRPGGWLALWANHPAVTDGLLKREIDAAYARLAPELAAHSWEQLSTGDRRADFGDLPADLAFGEAVEREYPWSRTYTPREWVDLMSTQSDHRMLAGDRRQALLDAVGQVLERHGGRYVHRFVCDLWAAPRL
jgi:SAM-dependent methyltransferase